jgi:hypothetical protein
MVAFSLDQRLALALSQDPFRHRALKADEDAQRTDHFQPRLFKRPDSTTDVSCPVIVARL